jgi:circadian clock protein KaiB
LPEISGANASPTRSASAIARSPKKPRSHQHWNLCLYVAGRTSESAAAFRNLKQICEEHLAGRYHIEVIDLLKNPRIGRDDQIVAVPTVVRKRPLPLRKIIGDLSDTESAVAGLDLRADSADSTEANHQEAQSYLKGKTSRGVWSARRN